MTELQLLSTDTALQILANQRRRRIVQHLIESDGPVPIDQLISAVSANTAPAGSSTDPHERIALELHHVHLPTLQDAGLIEVDSTTETIRYHPHDRIEGVLAACASS